MRNPRVLVEKNRIKVYTDWPSRLYFETPEMNSEELQLLRKALSEN